MKIRRIRYIFLLLFIVSTILPSACNSGETLIPSSPDDSSFQTPATPAVSIENLSNKVLKNITIIPCGNLLFTSQWSVIYRYNTATGTFRKACMDPECDGDCSLESGQCYPLQVVDGKLYFWTEMTRQQALGIRPTYLGSQDLVTGEVKILLEATSTQPPGGPEFVYDGMMYYLRTMLKLDVDPNDTMAVMNPDNYDVHICRIPITGGKEEVLRLAPDELLFAVADGYYLTRSAVDRCVFSYDRDFKEQTVFFDFGALGLRCASDVQYLNGTAYFYARRDGDDYNGFYSLDLATKELKLLVDKRISICRVTEDAIYYNLKESRYMYKPEGWDEMTDEQKEENPPAVLLCSAELYACDLDGQNERVVYTDAMRDYTEDYTVIDGVLYGWIYDFDEQTHKWKDRYFGSIDFESGEVTNIFQWTSSRKK